MRAREENGEFEMRIGYLNCRDCGEEFNCADLISGLCPTCARKRTDHLAELQREYQKYVDEGHERASAYVAELIRAYQQTERVRLKDVPPRYRVG